MYISLIRQKFYELIKAPECHYTRSDADLIRFWYTHAYSIHSLLNYKMFCGEFGRNTTPTRKRVMKTIDKFADFLKSAEHTLGVADIKIPVLTSDIREV